MNESKQLYDFTESALFLNENYPLDSLYLDVCKAMDLLSRDTKCQDREAVSEVWSTLLTCADFLETIQVDD